MIEIEVNLEKTGQCQHKKSLYEEPKLHRVLPDIKLIKMSLAGLVEGEHCIFNLTEDPVIGKQLELVVE